MTHIVTIKSRRNFIKAMRREFTKYGFITCPLSKGQLEKCFTLGLDALATYRVGYDVASAFDFNESLQGELS